MADAVIVESRGPVTVLRMRHGKVQALDLDLVDALAAALADARDAPALVLTGTGRAFSAGVDLKRLLAGDATYIETFLARLCAVMVQLFGHAGPVVAAVNGHAIAGGCVLALACDYKVMASGDATIGVPELRVGVPFPVAPLEILRFALADAHLQELVYAGRVYPAEAANARGLIDEVVDADGVMERAVQMARQFAAGPAARFRLTKQQLRRPALERIARDAPAFDPDIVAAWKDAGTLRAIDEYLKTLKRS
jgi:enoyl-CoA hydratase